VHDMWDCQSGQPHDDIDLNLIKDSFRTAQQTHSFSVTKSVN